MRVAPTTVVLVLLATTAAPALGAPPSRRLDVIYMGTPQPVVDRMLELAELEPGDVLYDLGSGDGRIVITAAQRYGVRAVGFEIDPARVRESVENARLAGVDRLVTFKQQDIFKADLADADVVTMYLLPTLNVRLMPQLAKMPEGSRVISHSFAMKGAKPDKIDKVPTTDGNWRTIFVWDVPWASE